MLKKATSLLVLALLPVILAGCGVLGVPAGGLGVNLQPTQLGFELDDAGTISIISNSVTFTNRANAAAALVTGYSIRFFDDADAEIVVDSDLTNVDGLAIAVPAGYSCPGGETSECGIGERIPAEQQSDPFPFIFLPSTVAQELVLSGATRVHAEIAFEAERGGQSLDWTVLVDVTMPVGGGE